MNMLRGTADPLNPQCNGKSQEENKKLSSLDINSLKLTDCTEICLSNKNLERFPDKFNIPLDVTKLNLENNIFVTLPEIIFKWEKLEYLNVAFNQINNLPVEIGKLKHLKTLDLKGNDLEELPESLGHLLCLNKLNASQNKLTTIPVSLGHLRNLTNVDLSHNLINSLPIALSCLECLTLLDISHNSIEILDTRPRWLNTISILYLQHNLLEILPQWLNEAPKLRELSVNHNPLSPQRNSSQGFLESQQNKNGEINKNGLQILDLTNCGIETTLPPKLFNLENLVQLHLGNENPPPCTARGRALGVQYNILLQLPAALPAALGAHLQVLDLQHLQLCGLPQDLSSLKALKVLLLRGNPLMWLPSTFSQLFNLEMCDLSQCQLIDLPIEIGNLLALKKLNVANNKLSFLPASMKSLLSLKYLDLYDNHFEVLPEMCMHLPALEALDLGYNYFLPQTQLQADDLDKYTKIKQKLRDSLQNKSRSDDRQTADEDYSNDSHLPSSKSDYESDGLEEEPVLNGFNDTNPGGDFVCVNSLLDIGLSGEHTENWGEPEEDSDENFDPFQARSEPWVTPPRWNKSVQSEHYFCPGDNHPPRTRRAVWHYLLPEPGQFDDAD